MWLKVLQKSKLLRQERTFFIHSHNNKILLYPKLKEITSCKLIVYIISVQNTKILLLRLVKWVLGQFNKIGGRRLQVCLCRTRRIMDPVTFGRFWIVQLVGKRCRLQTLDLFSTRPGVYFIIILRSPFCRKVLFPAFL